MWRDLGCAVLSRGLSGRAARRSSSIRRSTCAGARAVRARHDARLVGVIETHTHADHVSGHGILAREQAAGSRSTRSRTPSTSTARCATATAWTSATSRCDILHTPGHRPEHCCVAVSDRTRGDEPWLVLSGDALFVGDSGRPDLAVDGRGGRRGPVPLLHERLGGLDAAWSSSPVTWPARSAGAAVGQDLLDARLRAPLQPDARRDDGRGLHSGARTPIWRRSRPTMARIVELNRGPAARRGTCARAP